MALNIVFVMLGSLAVALILVPVLAVMLLKPLEHGENIIMRSIKKGYTPLLVFALNHAKVLIAVVTAAFIASVVLLSAQGREFMPELNEESIMYRVISIPGTGLVQSTQTAGEIEKYI